MTSTLRDWLAGRTPEELGLILRNRVEATRPFVPRSLGELTERLHYPHGLRAVLDVMPLPAIEVVETMLAFGSGGMSRADLAAILRLDADDAELGAVLTVAGQWALIWDHAGLLHLPGALRTVMPVPLGLGPTVEPMLAQRTADDLRALASRIGVATRTRKSDLLAELAAFYADAGAVRKLAALAPAAQRELIGRLAWHGPMLARDTAFLYGRKPDPAYAWLLEHGLLVSDWQHVMVPREVGIALRGPDWHPQLHAAPPEIPSAQVGAQAVERDAAAAANAAIEQVTAVTEACAATPVVPLKTGGIGVREIRRLAKALALPELTVRLWLEVAFHAGLIDADDADDNVVPTDFYDEWIALPPPARLAALADAWLDLPCVPLLATRPEGTPLPAALAPDSYGTVTAELRHDVIRAAARLPEGHAVATTAALAGAVAWARPLLASYLGDAVPPVEALWAEAHALGFAGQGALSGLARAALAGTDLDKAAVAYVHDLTREAIFQADLTVVVPGTPAPELAELLDAVADRESRGSAGTWRCSAASVRRALDAGRRGDELVEALRTVAVGHALPQPLEYLVADAARQHGRVRVRAVGCIVHAQDPALLAELVASRALASLSLSAVAPSVLISAVPVEATLAALRRAGYAPAGESPDGSPLIEARPARRVKAARSAQHIDERVLDVNDLFQEAIAQGVPIGEAWQQAAAVRDAIAAGADIVRRDVDTDDLARRLLGDDGKHGGAKRSTAKAPTGKASSGTASSGTASSGTASSGTASSGTGAGGTPAQRAAPERYVLDEVGRLARRLGRTDQRALAEAIEAGTPIEILYEAQDGEWTERVIEPIELDGKRLVAWCRLREDERNFALGNILSVRPL